MSLIVWFWIAFALIVFALLALDLGVFHKHETVVTLRYATFWTIIRVIVAAAFGVAIYLVLGHLAGLEYFTGYIIEFSLSMDNVFVFVLLFSFFNVPAELQHPVLFWGVLGAVIMRGILILLGSALLTRFHWIIYVFGAFLVITGARMALHREEELHPEKNPVLGWARRVFPVTATYEHDHFFVRKAGLLMATPLFLVLILIETTDLMFAVDSIPAIFAITRNPFIVLTSNVMAILGLRTLYFLLAGIMDLFRFLKIGLAFVLVFVGFKMLLSEFIELPIALSLGVVAGIILLSVVLSLAFPEEEIEEEEL